MPTYAAPNDTNADTKIRDAIKASEPSNYNAFTRRGIGWSVWGPDIAMAARSAGVSERAVRDALRRGVIEIVSDGTRKAFALPIF